MAKKQTESTVNPLADEKLITENAGSTKDKKKVLVPPPSGEMSLLATAADVLKPRH